MVMHVSLTLHCDDMIRMMIILCELYCVELRAHWRNLRQAAKRALRRQVRQLRKLNSASGRKAYHDALRRLGEYGARKNTPKDRLEKLRLLVANGGKDPLLLKAYEEKAQKLQDLIDRQLEKKKAMVHHILSHTITY
jgi:hypothetical protein